LFGQLHPTWGIGLANYFSRKSREKTGSADEKFLGEDNEWLAIYCREVLKEEHFDYFIFGHRHLPLDLALPGNSRYINLGDWIRTFTYAVLDGDTVRLNAWPS
jgi:UDP-2,3-diacylglucosamine hydrolase